MRLTGNVDLLNTVLVIISCTVAPIQTFMITLSASLDSMIFLILKTAIDLLTQKWEVQKTCL